LLEGRECLASPSDDCIPFILEQVPSDAEEVATLFASWKVAHGKAYASPLEDALRRDVFAENAQLVAAHNGRRDATFTLELNQFADTTWCASARTPGA
jgi:hypothetical protein